MKITIAASHRFHLLDLARELEKQGHEVRFYSYVPNKRAIKFGLSAEASCSLYGLMLPFLALMKLSKGVSWSVKLINIVMDYYLLWFMKPCDVFIALGTVYKNSLLVAKKKYGATTILEWGSKHIEEQQRIMAKMPNFVPQDKFFIERSLKGYEYADYIAIASDHVKQSFLEKGIPLSKLIQNPYGVDLSMFGPTTLTEKHYDIIMVGGWSYRKGCDLLTKVLENSNYTLLHVGSLVDLPFPENSRMTHIDSVDQRKLVNYYAQVKIFVLPSREEGLAMVQPQAIACGLPIVCSKDTGGRDLKIFVEDEKWIVEMKEFSQNCLLEAIEEALDLANQQHGLRNYAKNTSDSMSWSSYGKRYNGIIKSITV